MDVFAFACLGCDARRVPVVGPLQDGNAAGVAVNASNVDAAAAPFVAEQESARRGDDGLSSISPGVNQLSAGILTPALSGGPTQRTDLRVVVTTPLELNSYKGTTFQFKDSVVSDAAGSTLDGRLSKVSTPLDRLFDVYLDRLFDASQPSDQVFPPVIVAIL